MSKKICAKAISIGPEECKSILDSFQNNKTPGSDGIPMEFYERFWHLIEELNALKKAS